MINLQDFKFTNTREIFSIEDQSADGGVPLLKFRMFDRFDWMEHGITTRAGGVSKGIFSELNLSFTRGDEMASVDENFNSTEISIHEEV